MWIGSAVTAAGAAQLYASYELEGWVSAVLVNTGTASLLFVPLFLVQRAMNVKVQATQRNLEVLSDEVHLAQEETRQTLSELRQRFAASQTESMAAEEAELRAIMENPSCESVHEALERSIRLEEVSRRWGIRVKLVDPGAYVYARLLPSVDSSVVMHIEKRDGEGVAVVPWQLQQTPEQFMFRVAEELRKSSLYPRATFDPALVFTELGNALSVARSVKDRYALVDNMERAQQYVAPQWMIYDWGLGAWEGLQPYYIDRASLRSPDIHRHMLEKTWLDRPSFEEALETARLLDGRGRIEAM
ncbi:hypothetical protein ACPYOC_14955 [Ornithinimicrobium sp. W1665]|uniref:hypothetical protein n=1 Tax=Ornithinimicrobium sp. W1665 TaxID=3416666 RepID=UPI003CEC844A